MIEKFPAISQSMRTAYKECPRKVFYRYVAAIQPKIPRGTALIFGHAFHSGIEMFRRDIPMMDAIKAARDELKREFMLIDLETKESQEKAILLEVMLGAYYEVYEDHQKKWLPELKLEMDGEVGIIDGLCETDDGFNVIVEDKTCSIFNPDRQYMIAIDEQLLTYASMCRKAGYKIAGVRYRESRKSMCRINKNETIDQFEIRLSRIYNEQREEYYRQYSIMFFDRDIDLFEKRKAMLTKQITNDLLQESFDEWSYNSCSCQGKYGNCEYLPLCVNQADHLGQKYEPNGKEPLDNGKFQNQIWGTYPTNNVD